MHNDRLDQTWTRFPKFYNKNTIKANIFWVTINVHNIVTNAIDNIFLVLPISYKTHKRLNQVQYTIAIYLTIVALWYKPHLPMESGVSGTACDWVNQMRASSHRLYSGEWKHTDHLQAESVKQSKNQEYKSISDTGSVKSFLKLYFTVSTFNFESDHCCGINVYVNTNI